jgi:hypothetical protein
VVTALCAAGAVAAFADAAPTGAFPKGPLYGGGRLGSGKTDQLLTLRVSEDRKQLNLFPTVLATCDNGRAVTAKPTQLGVAVKGDGTFGGSAPYDGAQGTFSYSGKLEGDDPAEGVMRLQFSSGKAKCDTGEIGWTARAAAVEPGGGAQKKGARYYGLRQGKAIAFRVAKGGNSVSRLVFEMQFSSCDGASPPPAQIVSTSSAIKIKDGGFSKAEGFYVWSGGAPDSQPPDSAPPDRASIRWKIEAEFGKDRVTGTLLYTADVHDSKGRDVGHCESPKAPIKLERG